MTAEIAGAALATRELYGLRAFKATNASPIVLQNLDRKVIQSRINIPNGNSDRGWVHVEKRHFSGTGSQLVISKIELKKNFTE
ncbi:hypothetical protein [Neisseria weaveri]|uniref:hypothetical protein n=1 Tax=Neisseria weaveri TaxID=28091 RepID=UPI0002232669|nr:hypothetical protein [Neisseria weaveri]EGV36462.1 hypothetical protein l11_18060 [Neisseria weaveri LMG 5135]